MPFTVSHLTEDDIATFADLDDAAMKTWGFAQAMANHFISTTGKTRRDTVAGWMQTGFAQDSTSVWLKAVDVETGEMASAALWKFNLEPSSTRKTAADESKHGRDDAGQESTGSASKASETAPVMAPSEGAVVRENEAPPSMMLTMAAQFNALVDEFIGDAPYANLSVLVTHPKWQRKGAGALLVKWGCDEADRRGLTSVLQSSPAGLKLYQSCGFEVVQTLKLDLRPWGVDETELRRGMIRKALVRS